VEGFVLSRVDGQSSLHEIGATTGLGPKVREIVARLVELGAVFRVAGLGSSRSNAPNAGSFFPPASNGERTSDPGSPTSDRSSQPGAGPRSPATGASIAPSPPPPPPASTGPVSARQALLDEVCDLDLEQKTKVLDLFERLDTLTHYELLEIAPTASKKEVKSAYYKLAPSFHPDRFFRRELGSYKGRMEVIFARVTEAQETLVSKDRRAAYDAMLEEQGPRAPAPSTSGASAPLAGEGPASSGFDELTFEDPVARAPSIRPLAGGSESAGLFDFDLPGGDTVPAVAPPPPPRVRTADDDQRRREAFMSRLRGGATPSLSSEGSPASSTGRPLVDLEGRAEIVQTAADTLKRRFVEARETTDREQVARFVEVAQIAASRNDPVSAANAYRLAAKLAPEDTGLQELVRDWGLKAAVSMSESYFKQGEIDERSGRPAEAADCYIRATIGMPRSAVVHERAAAMLLLANGDSRRAVELARRAVELAPAQTSYRLTLAETYVNAKLFVTAKAELETVLEREPTNDRAKQLLKKIPR
jgi:curved DNA-binding protein CbpA